MPGGKKTYKVGNEVYEIPEAEAGSFLKDFPKAEEVNSFVMDKDTFDIPITVVNDFLKENPKAQPLKKKEATTTNSATGFAGKPSVFTSNTETYNPFDNGAIPEPKGDGTATELVNKWANQPKQGVKQQPVSNQPVYQSPAPIKEAEEEMRLQSIGQQEIRPEVLQAQMDEPVTTFKEDIENAKGAFIKGGMSGVGSMSKSIAVAAKKFDWFNEYENQETKDLATYQYGDWLQKKAQELFPEDERYQDSFYANTLPQAGGNLALLLMGGVGARALKMSEGMAASMMGAAMNGANEYEAALQATNDPDVAWKAYMSGTAIGTLEGLPIASFFGRLDKLSGGKAKTTFARFAYEGNNPFVQGTIGGLQEGVEEIVSQTLNNKSAQELYDESRKLTDGLIENGGAGFLLGAALRSSLAVVQNKLQDPNTTTEEKVILQKAEQEIGEKLKSVKEDELLQPKELAVDDDKANGFLNASARNIESTEKQFAEQVKAGTMRPETAEMLLNKAKERKELLKKIPDYVTVEQQDKITTSLAEKEALIEESKTKDDVFKDSYKAKIEAIDNKIKAELGIPTAAEIQKRDKVPYGEAVRRAEAESSQKENSENDVKPVTQITQNNTPSGINPQETTETIPEQVQNEDTGINEGRVDGVEDIPRAAVNDSNEGITQENPGEQQEVKPAEVLDEKTLAENKEKQSYNSLIDEVKAYNGQNRTYKNSKAASTQRAGMLKKASDLGLTIKFTDKSGAELLDAKGKKAYKKRLKEISEPDEFIGMEDMNDDERAFVEKILPDAVKPIGSDIWMPHLDLELDSRARAKAGKDIAAGKKSKEADQMLRKLKDFFEAGELSLKVGTGGNISRHTFPISELENPKSDAEAELFVTDDVKEEIFKNGITLENLESFKEQLFNGFPFDENDYLAVKKHLENETTETSGQVEDSSVANPEELSEESEGSAVAEQEQVAKSSTSVNAFDEVADEKRRQEFKDLISSANKGNSKPLTSDGASFEELLEEEFPIDEPLTGRREAAKRMLKSKYDNAKKEFKKSLAEAAKDIRKALDDLGTLDAVYDPQKQAQKLYNLHVALVNFAKIAISNGAQSVQDMATQMGYKANTALEKAWEEATGIRPPAQTVADLGYKEKDIKEITESLADGKKMRGFGKRVKEYAEFADMKAKIELHPDSYYAQQSIADSKIKIDNMTDQQRLDSMDIVQKMAAISSEDNVGVLAAIDLINRAMVNGQDTSPIFEQLNKAGTTIGQLLRQFAEVKGSTSAGIVNTIEKALEKMDRFLLPDQKQKLTDLATEYLKARQRHKDAIAAAKAAQTITPQMEQNLAALAKDFDSKYIEMAQYINRLVPRETWDIMGMAMQGNLLTPLSIVTNVYSNMLLIPVKGASSALMIPSDWVISNWRKSSITSRTLIASPRVAKGAAKGAWIGLKAGLKQFATGIDLTGDNKAEITRGFQPLKAWVQLMTGADMPVNSKGKIAAKDRLNKLLEGTVGMPAELFFRMLSLGDKVFYYGSYHAHLAAAADKKGLGGEARRKFLMFPDTKTLKSADGAAKEATFQEDSLTAKLATTTVGSVSAALRNIPMVGGALNFVLKTQMPYVKTPANVISQTLDFAVPPVSLGKAMYAFYKGDRREGLLNLGKAVTGSMMLAVADMLFNEGIITGAADDEEKERALQYKVAPPYSLNLSALNRLQNGESTLPQDGDEWINMQKMGIIGSVFGIRSDIGNNFKEQTLKDGRKPDAVDYVLSIATGFAETASFTLEQSFLKGTSALLDAIKEKKYDQWLTNTFKAMSSTFLPNTFDALNRATRDFVPSVKGDDVEDKLANVIKNKLWMTEDLPIKHGLFGDPIKQSPENANPYIYQLIDVTKRYEVPEDHLPVKIYELYKTTQNADAIPSSPARTITISNTGIRLTDAEYEEYIFEVGQERRRLAEKLIKGGSFNKLTAEKQIKRLDFAYDSGLERAKYKFIKKHKLRDRIKK